tara:strand:- start:2220 stop:4046 length:1827 start_codon:yes stop_codon:yes gene_type:complete
MVKLIRITSEFNGNFNADLDAGIALGEDSRIALKNLTFESEFKSLVIDGTNDEAIFCLDTNNDQTGIPTIPAPAFQPFPPFATGIASLTNRGYTTADYKEFYADLEGALNSTLGVGVLPVENYGDIYSSFLVDDKTNPDRPRIMYKYNPITLPFSTNLGVARTEARGNLIFGQPEDDDQASQFVIDTTSAVSGSDINTIKQVPSGTEGNTYDKYIYALSGQKWSQGSAMFMTSLYNLTNTASAANVQGFGIGLSYTNLEVFGEENALTLAQRDFEVLIEKNDEPYRFISPAAVGEQTASVSPHKFDITTDTNETTHDRIFFERKLGVINAYVWTTEDAGGKSYPLFTYTIPNADRSKPLYPYIYIKGAAANCTVGTPCVTMDSFMQGYGTTDPAEFPNAEYEITGGQTNSFGAIDSNNNAFQRISSGFELVTPNLNNRRFNLDFAAFQRPQITLEARVLKFLGFDIRRGDQAVNITVPETQIQIDNEDPCGFILQGINDTQVVNSDSYVVVLDSNPLMSYDASQFDYSNLGTNLKQNKRGRRLNILDTIPVNNNTGILEYNANELVYIDFDNKYPQTLKNIKIRVLDKQLFPITTFGTSTMTLLIDTN